jgi:hypothetical protein
MKLSYEELQGYKNNDTKRVNMILYTIWNDITGEEWVECFCNKEERLKFNLFFFEWLEKNKDKI